MTTVDHSKHKTRPDFLAMLAMSERSTLLWVGLFSGLLLLVAGTVMFLYPFTVRPDAVRIEDLTICVFGCAAVTVGQFLVLFVTVCHMAYHILLRVDGRTDTGSSFQPPSNSWLRELSTRDLNVRWRLLVMVPLFVGVLLLLLAIGAWQVPTFDAILLARGVRLEYLCIGGVALMLLAACLIPLGGIVHGRASKRDRVPR